MTGRPAAREDGFTLVELMVVMLVGGIVLGIATSALIQSQQTVAGTLQRQFDLGEARGAADAASADLRTLVPLGGTYLLTATAREASFYALRDVGDNEGPVRIRIVLEANGDLVRYSTRPSAASGPAPSPSAYSSPEVTQRRILASGLQSGQAVFRYYASYTLVPVPGASPSVSPSVSELPLVAPSPSGSPSVATANRNAIRFVEIVLQVQQPGARDVGATSVRQVVRLPNM